MPVTFLRTFPLLAALALCACATEPDPASANASTVVCAVRDTPTGSMIVKREPCVVLTDADRAEARKQAEAMRRDQQISRPATPKPAGN